VTPTNGLARSEKTQVPEQRRLGFPGSAWSSVMSGAAWPLTSVGIAVVSAAIVFAVFGVGGQGTALALQVTGRWSFLLFWLAYAGSAAASLVGPRLAGWARRGRELGLSFAAAQFFHVGIVLWHYRIATEPVGAMVFFWGGVLCTGFLTLFSVPRLRHALGPRLWRIFCTVALEYIALVFAADFIVVPLRDGYDKYPLSYLPFAVLLAGGASLRFAAWARRMTLRDRPLPGFRFSTLSRASSRLISTSSRK
jgi:hypothetical protein